MFRTLTRLTVPGLLGLGAAAAALTLDRMAAKYVVGFAAGVALALALALRADAERLGRRLLALLALGIPIGLNQNFFHRPHVGGAAGVTVTLTDLAMVAIAGLWWYRGAIARSGRPLRVHPGIAGAHLAFMAAGVLSLLNAPHPDLVGFELLRLGKLLFILVLVTSLRDDDEVSWFVKWLAVGVVLEAILALLQFLLKTNLGLGLFGEQEIVDPNLPHVLHRATGTIGHPNALGYYFELLVPLMAALALAARTTAGRIAYGGAALLGLAGIFATLSRGAWVGLPVSLTLVTVGVMGRRLLRLETLRALALGAVVLGAVVIAFYPTIERRLTSSDYMSAGVRMPLNRAAFSLVAQHPLVGVGLNNFSEVFKIHDTTGHSRIFRGYKHVVHNLYLLVWAEVGSVGLAAFAALFGFAFAAAVRVARRGDARRRALAVGALSGLLAHLLHGAFDPGFVVSPPASTLVYALLGLLGCLALLERHAPAPAAAREAA